MSAVVIQVIKWKVVEMVIWNVLFPEKCMVCGNVLGDRSGVCIKCKKELSYIRGARCSRCGKKISGEETVCSDCRKHRHIYSQGYALLEYNKKTEALITSVKYYHRTFYMEWLTKELIYYSEPYINRWKPQLVIPVPLHKSRYRKRGFNQAGLIAEPLAKAYGIQYDDRLLLRRNKTKAQKYLNDAERSANLKNAFVVNMARIDRYRELEKVVIVDDIYTTGSTIDACAKELIRVGVKEVYFVTLSAGNGYN